LWTICLGWPPTLILLISASQVAGITGMITGTQLQFCILITVHV
jgi:hypothetical protein